VIEIHPSARVSPLADIEDSTRGTRIVVGPRTVIDSFVKIKPVGGAGDVIIGAGCYLNSGVVIYSGNGIQMGDGVLIAANCTLAPVNHEFFDRSRAIREQGFGESKGGIRVGADVWLGAGCVILDGADIGEGCVVGALSLVRGSLPPYSVCAGRPAAPIGQRT
jgi:virginiamycin A acetyltransferase